MKYIIFVLLCTYASIIWTPRLFGQNEQWITYYERSGYLETPRYQETIRFSKSLADHSPMISYKSLGTSPQGRDLPLLIIDNKGLTTVEDVRNQGKAVILIQACIHSGESDGKDAGLMLARDMAIHAKNVDLLDNVTLLFVPIFNVDGHERFGPYNRINQNGPKEMGYRTTAQRLNLNRDFLKADAPEMQAMIKLYTEWLPDFYIDCHVTDGADYIYPLTYGLQINGNLDDDLSDWLRSTYLPFIEVKMEASGNPISPYLGFVEWHNPSSGMRAYMETPRYSGGYAALHNRPALLIETHMLKDYKTRVLATYEMLLHSIEIFAEQSFRIQQLNKQADESAAAMFRSDEEYTLTFRSSEDAEKFTYKGFEYEVAKSEVSGGDWYTYSDQPATFEIDYFPWEPDKTIKLPSAYVIPAEWQEIISKLELHGVELTPITSDTTMKIETYQLSNVSWRQRPFEGRLLLDYKTTLITRHKQYPKGSMIAYLDQRTAQLIVHALEPDAPDCFLRWGFMNQIFEQKEYAESYVMEKMAREMMNEDPELKARFEAKGKNDSSFASSPWAILNWFYQQSPYWDEEINVYPIGRLLD